MSSSSLLVGSRSIDGGWNLYLVCMLVPPFPGGSPFRPAPNGREGPLFGSTSVRQALSAVGVGAPWSRWLFVIKKGTKPSTLTTATDFGRSMLEPQTRR
jgi:hypothetical protein